MLEGPRTLSEWVRDQISACDRVPEWSGLNLINPSQYNQLMFDLTRALIDSLESFNGEGVGVREGFQKIHPEFLKHQLDFHLTSELIDRIPGFVERITKLSELSASRQPGTRVESYIREATRCFVFGLWQASIALSRAAVEQALRERVIQVAGQTHHKLGELIRGASLLGVLDNAHAQMATTVKLAGDEVLHGGDTRSGIAWDALVAARGVLEHLHA